MLYDIITYYKYLKDGVGFMERILKQDIANYIAGIEMKNSKLTVKESETIVNSVFEFIKQKMKDGNEIRISDFGSFLVVNKDAREGINPITGEKISIVAKKSPKIKFFPSFKKFLND